MTAVRDAVQAALVRLEFRVAARDHASFTAHTAATIFSWGEELSVRLEQNAASVRVTVSSEARAQIFDWGKSTENIQRVFVELDKALK